VEEYSYEEQGLNTEETKQNTFQVAVSSDQQVSPVAETQNSNYLFHNFPVPTRKRQNMQNTDKVITLNQNFSFLIFIKFTCV